MRIRGKLWCRHFEPPLLLIYFLLNPDNDKLGWFQWCETDDHDNLTGIDLGRGCIQVGEPIETGRRVVFCRRDHDSARADLRRMLKDVKKRAGGRAKAALYFSCVARGRNLFGDKSEELKLIEAELGDLPLAGFFANGEISNDRLYGYTGVLALFC